MATDEVRWVAEARRGDRNGVSTSRRGLLARVVCAVHADYPRFDHGGGCGAGSLVQCLSAPRRLRWPLELQDLAAPDRGQCGTRAAAPQRQAWRHARRDEHSDDDGEDFLASRPDEAPTPDRHALGGEIGRQIQDQLARMSTLERTAFVMRHHEGQSLETIAETLSLNISASKQAIFRAVRKLRGALEPLR
jgi:RNA polymerase sigma factor (sigma-70 family)